MNGSYPYVDFALVSLFVFFGFFIGLVIYLRREDRREGYPLEEDASGRLRPAGGLLFTARPKTFVLPDGRGTFFAPNDRRDRRELAARRMSVVPGSPMQPTGNPMNAGIGPGSFAERAKVPDRTAHGDPKIVPMSAVPGFSIAKGDLDPRGLTVLGTDGLPGGVVDDVWVDRAEAMVRYLQVKLGSDNRSVLLPITMAKIDKRRKLVKVEAITSSQFSDVPALAHPDQVTLYEEERVTAYYGGGFLYATPGRGEPLL